MDARSVAAAVLVSHVYSMLADVRMYFMAAFGGHKAQGTRINMELT